jgi:hypothetical protein
MPLFDQYTKPGVYVQEMVSNPGIPLFGQVRIPVLIGEGTEQNTTTGINLHRGSSSFSDESVVRDNISDQVTGTGRTYQLPYTPVVTGDGSGSVTNNPQYIQVFANNVPLMVSSLNGATGVFTTQNILPQGTDLRVNYYFKRFDTYVTNELLSSQIPSFAQAALQGGNILVSPVIPGELANSTTIAFTMVSASANLQGLVFTASVGGPVGTQLSVQFVSGGSLGYTVVPGSGNTNTVVEISVAANTELTEILSLFQSQNVSATISGTLVQIQCSNPTGVDLSAVAAATSAMAFTLAGVSDSLAVSGYGTDTISIEVVNANGGVRTLQDLVNLLNAGVASLSGGTLSATFATGAVASAPGVVAGPVNFQGGQGPNSNTTFFVKNQPIVDGTNGGVVTTNPSDVKVMLNGVPVQVASVNGLNGSITLTQGVSAGSTLSVSYYTNTYQDTFDVLPGDNIVSITNVGYAVGRNDFTEGIDYVLQINPDGAVIQWGASYNVQIGNQVAGYTAFDGSVVTCTLVDEQVFLQNVSGVVNGKNYTFVLNSVPTDGSGLDCPTNNPANINVYVGPDPITALMAGPVRVTYLQGNSATFTLYNPPAGGNNVYASYWRNLLQDNTYTLTCLTPGTTAQGTYTISDNMGNTVPYVSVGECNVTEAGEFDLTGIVWPNKLSDLKGVAGASPVETITLTFQDDGLQFYQSNAVQATNLTSQAGLRFRATNTGQGPNNTTQIVLSSSAGATSDASAVSVVGEIVTVQIVNGTSGSRTLQDVINLFTTGSGYSTTAAGRIICEPSGPSVVLSSYAIPTGAGISTFMTGGATAVAVPYSNRFKVTSNRTKVQSQGDGQGITGGATTPVSSNVGSTAVGADGYLGQTFIDIDTGIQFTIVDPNAALSYGFTALPTPTYHYQPGDTITLVTNTSNPWYTSGIPIINVPGLRTKVISTYGMASQETALLNTFNKAGNTPQVGDYYYVDYVTQKTASEMGLNLYTNVQDIYKAYGQPLPVNKLSLAAMLFTQNGGQIVGCIQVPKQTGLDTASDQAFMAAIDQLNMALPGSDQKADVIVPLSTSSTVQQYLCRHLITQATERFNGEAMGYIGFDMYSTPNDARAIARAMRSDRVIALYPGAAIMSLVVNGLQSQFAVSGEFVAAALAGLDCNPANDVATSLTRQNLVGFSNLATRYDDTTMDQAAADGVCWVIERAGALQIRHYMTTDPSTPITREPTNRKITDEVRYRLRTNLDQFIARKILVSLVNDITATVNATMRAMIEQQLVENYGNLTVTRDASDPTVIHVELSFKPVFSLMWLDIQMTVTTNI